MRLRTWALLVTGSAIGTSVFISSPRDLKRWQCDPQAKWERFRDGQGLGGSIRQAPQAWPPGL